MRTNYNVLICPSVAQSCHQLAYVISRCFHVWKHDGGVPRIPCYDRPKDVDSYLYPQSYILSLQLRNLFTKIIYMGN